MTKKYTIDIDEETWQKFKETVTKNDTINDAIVRLIKAHIN